VVEAGEMESESQWWVRVADWWWWCRVRQGREIHLDNNYLSGTLAPDLWKGLTGLE
jgi:hypothetical protein